MSAERRPVTNKCVQTFVEAAVYDPFPTTITKRYDNCTREAIVAAMQAEYKDDLIGLVVYDVSVIVIDLITFYSEPLNKQRWQRS